jgi:alcohol dehydrogenase
VIEFARLAGTQTIVMDVQEGRLEFCRQTMGVQHTVLFRGDNQAVDRLREVADGHLPTIVIDATGNPQSMSGALQYVEHSGRLVYVGITTEEIHFPHRVFHAPEMTLLASRNSLPADFRRIIQLIEDQRLDTRPWITHRTDFDHLIDEFESFTQPSTGVIKAIVEVPDS